jgi:tRNA threonylcarbamoyladenosine biosynthesis protein TsaB
VILSLETSTTVTSAALHNEGKLIALEITHTPNSAASQLAVMIDNLLRQYSPKLDAVAVSSGPGSYTGLRIGVATAKGICYALSLPLIAINSLELMAAQTRNLETRNSSTRNSSTKNSSTRNFSTRNSFLCPMIDARRMEVYTMLLNDKFETIQPVTASVIDESSYSDILNYKKIFFFGNGSDKCKAVITHPNAVFIDNIFPSAEWMGATAFGLYREKKFEDVSDFEPAYLKDFIAKKPKSLV